MKRDMDLIRRIALEIADMPARHVLTGVDNIDPDIFAMHVTWMEEAGLVEAHITRFVSDDPPRVRVVRLTWEGCDFVDAARSDTLWKKTMETVIRPTSSFTFGIIKEYLKSEIRKNLPGLGG